VEVGVLETVGCQYSTVIWALTYGPVWTTLEDTGSPRESPWNPRWHRQRSA